MVDKAKVVKTDIQISNGVIHVIDEVLMPPAHQSQPQGKKKGQLRPVHSYLECKRSDQAVRADELVAAETKFVGTRLSGIWIPKSISVRLVRVIINSEPKRRGSFEKTSVDQAQRQVSCPARLSRRLPFAWNFLGHSTKENKMKLIWAYGGTALTGALFGFLPTRLMT